MSRPEHSAAPEIFYNETEARKYAQSSRMKQIQGVISERALELLNLEPGPKMLLDIGCGTGMSGETLEDHGHFWVGMDISVDMLNIASERIQYHSEMYSKSKTGGSSSMADNDDGEESSEEEEDDEISGAGDVIARDMGQGVGFRGGVFDGAISISAVQWLCYASKKSHIPRLRLKRFFQQLYHSLNRGARAVIQLYPETPQQMELITNSAMACGFGGSVVVDYPNSAKAKKYYLVLTTGPSASLASETVQDASKPVTFGASAASGQIADRQITEAQFEKRRQKFKQRQKHGRAPVKSRDWIQDKKERQRKQGKNVRPDSKFSGRRRKPRF